MEHEAQREETMEQGSVMIRPYREDDIAAMVPLWNEVVEAGVAFPQEEPLTYEEAKEFFAGQSLTAVAVSGDEVCGLYILHPNGIGRLAHIANASYAVAATRRGEGIGRLLVEDSLVKAGSLGFTGLQFNAVVASNTRALRLYGSIGFEHIGIIPDGFRNKEGHLEAMHIFYKPCPVPPS